MSGLQYYGHNFVHIEVQGELFAMARESNAHQPLGGGIRSEVTEFSAASRRRLMRRFARLKPTRVTFVTLTYPETYPSASRAKEHLRAFLERIRRAYKGASGIWRFEFQKRGAPHFHIMFFGLPFVPFETIRNMWREIIGLSPGETLFVRINLVDNWSQVKGYMSKYVAKENDWATRKKLYLIYGAYPHAGRWWGVFNKQHLPFAPKHYLIFRVKGLRAFHDAKKMLRRRYSWITKKRGYGCVVMASDAPTLWDCALRLLMPDISPFPMSVKGGT